MKADNEASGLLEKVREKVKPEYAKLDCWAHGWPHVYVVEQYTETLAGREGQNKIVCGIAGYCHDLGRITEQERAKQQTDGISRELGKTQNHAYFSVLPTILILEELGIRGKEFDDIVGAVALHSRKDYFGNNLVAKILRDADKLSGLGPWAVLRIGKFMFDMDIPAPDFRNQEAVEAAAEETMKNYLKGEGGIYQGKKVLEEYLRCVNFNQEWEDMLHTDTAREIGKPLFEYDRERKKEAEDALKAFEN